MSLSPTVAIHICASLSALALGPFVLWARLGKIIRVRWHRALGYAWTTCMIAAAISALFIRSIAEHSSIPNIYGYTPIHLFVVLTAFSLIKAFLALHKRDFVAHRRYMRGLYLFGCVGTGVFTLLPSRYLGQLVWGEWLGWL